MKSLSLKLLDYHQWANNQLLDRLTELPSDLFICDLNSVFPTISDTFGHIYMVDKLWLHRMQNGDFALTPKTFENISQVRSAFELLYIDINQFIKSVDLSKIINYKNSKGHEFNNSVFEIVQHLVYHGNYHRGNIASMIRNSGNRGIETDFIMYLRNKK